MESVGAGRCLVVGATLALVLACGDERTRGADAVSVVVSPASLTIEARSSVRFHATVTGTSDARLSWSADEGSLEDGTWTAPDVPGTYRITARSVADPSKAAEAWATVVRLDADAPPDDAPPDDEPPGDAPPVEEPVTVTIVPDHATVVVGFPVRFEARVAGTDDVSVSWSVADPPAASTVDANGTFIARYGGTYRVIATSVADPTKSAVAVVTVWNDLVDHGGWIVPKTRTFALWWGPPADFEPDVVLAVEGLLTGLDGSVYLAVTDQYMRGARATTGFAGSFFDSSPPPQSPGFVVVDAACQALLNHGITPAWGDVVFVYSSNFPEQATPWCAWHSYTTCNGMDLLVAYVPNPTGTNFCEEKEDLCGSGLTLETLSRVSSTSHELIESITDPFGDAWHSGGHEALDKCGIPSCVPLTNGTYLLQELYSNAVHGCAVE